jgi:tryptophan synthase alpha chain
VSRIADTFARLDASGKKALIPYIMAGDPSLNQSLQLMQQLVQAGADIIELGMPFSDPMADGPVIQLAGERSLAAGTTLKAVLDMVARFRQQDGKTPVVLMGYLNPVEAMGYEVFAATAAGVGVDALLLVDLPPEEAADVQPLFQRHGLDLIFLLAPTTTDRRVARVAELGSGYLYYVSLKGVTGAATLDVPDVQKHLKRIQQHARLPVCVGFGIKDAASAAAVAKLAAGVVVGSALVNQVAAGTPEKAVSLLADMRHSMDQ